MKVYPQGVRVEPKGLMKITPPEGYVRGKIEGFSAEAASRLREFCVTMEVPGRVPLNVTLTTKGKMNPDQWRAAWMRFRQRARRADVGIVWRVELQRRKAPHVHLVAWVAKSHRDAPQHRRLFTEEWLECVREENDPDSKRYAVKVGEVLDNGWLIYLALHGGKRKESQLGWKGKQWGVINRHLFKRRECIEKTVTDRERFYIQRACRSYQRSKRRLVGALGDVGLSVDYCHSAGLWRQPVDGIQFLDARAYWRHLRRKGLVKMVGKKVRHLPQVNAWLRCIPETVTRRLVESVGDSPP